MTLAFSSIGTVLGLIAVALLVLANAFFVAAEFGLVAVERAQIDEAADAGSKPAILVRKLLTNLSYHLSGAQLGITASSLILGSIAKPSLGRVLELIFEGFVGDSLLTGLSIVGAIALATTFQMVVGELVPKTIAIYRPYEASTRLSSGVRVWGLLAKPVITTFDAAANWTVRRIGIEPAEELLHLRSLDEIEQIIVSSGEEGTLDDEEVTLLKRSLRLREKSAADALIPRMEVLALESTAVGEDLVRLSLESGKSRFPVYGIAADDVVGVVHVKAIYGIETSQRNTTPVIDLMSSALFVPETIDLDDLLARLRESRAHMAVVVDEHGGTAGVITIEDILEELVGEIEDEYDFLAPIRSRVERRGSYLVSGSLHHDEVEEACDFTMPEGEFETLAGFVLAGLGRIPVPGDSLTHDGWQIEVVAMDRRRVASIRLIAPEELPYSADGQLL